MPIMDGLAASNAIRAWERERQIIGQAVEPVAIVALTANAIAGYKQDCIDAGMNDYLTKPITLQRLKEIALKYIGEPSAQPASQRSQDRQAQKSILHQQPVGQESSTQNLQKRRTLTSLCDAQKKTGCPVLPVETNENQLGQPRIETSRPVVDSDLAYLDLHALDSRCIGNQEIRQQVLSIMHDTMPDRLAELRRAIDNCDLTSVGLVAHKLKGAAGDASLLAVQESASCLEQYAYQDHAERIPDMLVELESRIAATICEIEKLLNQSEPATKRNQ